MQVSEHYKEILMGLYKTLKETEMLFDELIRQESCNPSEVRQTFCKVYDIMEEFINERNKYVENINVEFLTTDDYNYIDGYAGSPIEQYRKVKGLVENKKGKLAKREISKMCDTVFLPCIVVEQILNEADFKGDIEDDLYGNQVPPECKPHFWSEEEIAAEELKKQRRREEYYRQLKDEEERWEVMTSHNLTRIIAYLEIHAEKKAFFNPDKNEKDFYYKLDSNFYTSDGHQFGYKKLKEWNIEF